MRYATVWRSAPITLAACVSFSLATKPLSAETTWNYDFGSGTGSFTGGESTTFLPQPPAAGGTARVRVGSGGGQFSLVNPGSGSSSLVGTASDSTSVNKFSIYDFAGTGLFSVEAELTFSGGDSGNWQLFVGNGATFTNNSGFVMAETFTGVRWDYEPSAGLTMSRRADGSESWLVSRLPTLSQNTSTTLAIYGNNTTAAVTYGGHTLAPGTWDLWVDGAAVSTGLPKASLPTGTTIDSLMFYGASSTANAATLTVDTLSYANAVPEPTAWSLALMAIGTLLAGGRWRQRRLCPAGGNWPTAA
jgi:hypothetical protein